VTFNIIQNGTGLSYYQATDQYISGNGSGTGSGSGSGSGAGSPNAATSVTYGISTYYQPSSATYSGETQGSFSGGTVSGRE
jgi:hypothetical protein